MSALRRPGLTMLVALALWLPSALGLLAGNITVDDAALRFVAALGAAWVGMAVFARVTDGYHHAPTTTRTPGSEPPPG